MAAGASAATARPRNIMDEGLGATDEHAASECPKSCKPVAPHKGASTAPGHHCPGPRGDVIPAKGLLWGRPVACPRGQRPREGRAPFSFTGGS
eukprot:9960035-Alexandrium_andersonii.AAC.1